MYVVGNNNNPEALSRDAAKHYILGIKEQFALHQHERGTVTSSKEPSTNCLKINFRKTKFFS